MKEQVEFEQDNNNNFEGISAHLTDLDAMTPFIDFESGKHLKQEKVTN